MFSGKATPHMLVLLWHHCIYYKRHWFILILTVLTPFLIFGLLHYLVGILTSGQLMSTTYEYTRCDGSPYVESPFRFLELVTAVDKVYTEIACLSPFYYISDGPLSALLSDVCISDARSQPDHNLDIQQTCVPFSKHPNERVLDAGFDGTWSCTDHLGSNCEFGKYTYNYGERNRWCNILADEILFYPNTKASNAIMARVTQLLEQFKTFMNTQPGKSLKNEPPKYITNALKSLSNSGLPQFKSGLRVKGFESFSELQKYTMSSCRQYNCSSVQSYGGFSTGVPYLWGALSFEGLPESIELAKHMSYDILYDTKSASDSTRLVWLQELVERAIVEAVTGNKTVDLGVAFKPMPIKCWRQPANQLYEAMSIVIPLALMISFLFSPANFLTQVLTEKNLKLREYLYIMGVGSMTLKISWILFYCIFLIPLSIIISTMIYLFPGSFFARTDPSLVFFFIIGYNVSQLAFCYMLSNALQQPRKSGIIITFLHTFFFIISVIQVYHLDITGSKLALARLTSLYPIVPLVIAMKYITSWEGQWVGAKWSNLFLSPVPTDEYGGMGEAFLWMIADIFIYLILAWYFEKVFPGEFGQKLKFYFPFLPSYWRPKAVNLQCDATTGTVDVEHVENKDPGVILDKLTKMYAADKIGVNQLSLTFYKNEITAFLGQNGAGKSTTMNSLVGLISATSGQASVHGFDMVTQMHDIRRIVGFVPQYDILYPDMTVLEHLQFFGWLKGLTKADIKRVTEPLLKEFGIDHLKNNMTTVLSGGQKRKLSILTGFLGAPKVIIFDEPTSGVDPFSRRSIWELILRHKKHNTTILSTHDMDEADTLAERIAIIAQGQLCCVGTPMYLKNKYGKGFMLTIACKPNCDKQAIQHFISCHVPNSRLIEERGTDLDFSIPIEIAHSSNIIELLEKVEEKQHSMGIVSYGISEPTMDEVFFTAADIEKDVETKALQNAAELPMTGIELIGSQNELAASNDLQYSKRAGSVESIMHQALAMFHKRLLMAIFSWSGILLQILLPLTFIILLVLVGGAAKQFATSAGTVKNVNLYDPARQNTMFVIAGKEENDLLKSVFKNLPDSMSENPAGLGLGGVCSSCREACDDSRARQAPSLVTSSDDMVYRVGTATNITNWILQINQTHSNVIAGFQFHKTNPNAWKHILKQIKALPAVSQTQSFNTEVNQTTAKEYVTVWYQPRLRQAVVNLWSNYLLRRGDKNDVSISMNLRAEELIERTASSRDIFQEDFLSTALSALFLIFCFAFSTFGIAVFIQNENSTGLKRLQLIYGANPFIYWIVNFVFDFLLYFITVMLVAFLLGVTNNPFNKDIGHIIAIGLPYGFMTVAFFYLLSFLFQRAKGIVIFTVVSTLVFIFVGTILSALEIGNRMCKCRSSGYRSGRPCPLGWTIPLNYFLRCFPVFLFVDSTVLIASSSMAKRYTRAGAPIAKCFTDIQSFEMLGKNVLMAIIFGLIYFAIVLVLEWFDVRINLKKLCCCCCRAQNRSVVIAPANNNTDVNEETRRVEQGKASADPLVVRGLTKVYDRMVIPAVGGITFGVSKSETFGLLGVNGAGKTTTFRMLTGYLEPTGGIAVLENNQLFGSKKSWTRFRDSSYCPQENTLFDSLTIEQHLRLFAKLRSIPSQFIQDVIRSLIHEVGLETHKGKRAAQLSGGNQRKLQFALALLDYRPVIFLDEPTTGMDPGARRKAWNSIKRATDRGCSVVLTSHSMEECEALCHRIVIMVSGTFQCIGSVQYLKDKFGNKYTFKIKIRPKSATQADSLDEGSVCDRVKQFIHERVPYSQLQEEHATMLHFDVPCTPQLKLPKLFSVLQECRSKFGVEDVSVTQTTLEQVFINMARAQQGIVTPKPSVLAPAI